MAVPLFRVPDLPGMNPLDRPSQEYRAVYQRVTELALGLLAELNQLPSFPNITGEESLGLFVQPLPEEGLGPFALDDLRKVIEASRPPSPRR